MTRFLNTLTHGIALRDPDAPAGVQRFGAGAEYDAEGDLEEQAEATPGQVEADSEEADAYRAEHAGEGEPTEEEGSQQRQRRYVVESGRARRAGTTVAPLQGEEGVITTATAPTVGAGLAAEVNATAAAIAKAEDLGVDLAEVEGSGAGGRVTVGDVEAAAEE